MNVSFEIKPITRNRGIPAEAEAPSELKFPFSGLFSKNAMSVQQKAEFCTQLSVMLQARISLTRALEILFDQSKNARVKEVVEKLVHEVKKGNSFGRALSLQPAVFDNLFAVSAEIGEETGHLPDVFSNLAVYLEKISALRKRIIQAMAYPALVLSVALGAVVFLLTFIVPTFAEMFKSFQVELPFSTRVVLRISEMMMSYGPAALLLLLILVVVFRSALRSSFIRQKMEGYVYRLPFLGGILVKNQVARFCRTLGTLLRAQVSLVDALEVTQRIFSNEEIKSEIARITQYVRQGRTIAEPLVESRFFPRMVSQMIAVGEETSELDAMLMAVAEYYEKEIDGKVETLSSVIEPVIIVLLGFLVGGILISIYMPMFDLVNVVGGQ